MIFRMIKPQEQRIGGSIELWQKCKLNPISDIFLEYYKDGYMPFRKTLFRFCDDPDTWYCTTDTVGSSDDWWTNPVEYIKKVLPTNLYDRIYYFLDPLGTLIILKGNFNELPMSDIQRYFDIEILSTNKFALIEKNRNAQKARVFAYLEKAAYKV